MPQACSKQYFLIEMPAARRYHSGAVWACSAACFQLEKALEDAARCSADIQQGIHHLVGDVVVQVARGNGRLVTAQGKISSLRQSRARV